MEAERLPRGADPTLNTKLGRGGLADVEWTVQLLQLRHAATCPRLRTTSTLDALVRRHTARPDRRGGRRDARVGWRLATRVRNALVLARGRAGGLHPDRLRDVVRIARMVGYSPSQSGDFLDVYRRVTRRSRAVVDKVFYA